MEFDVQATIIISCIMSLEAKNEKEAEKEALGYFDNSANIESDYYDNICVTDIVIDSVNES